MKVRLYVTAVRAGWRAALFTLVTLPCALSLSAHAADPAFTDAEKEWIAAHGEVRFSADPNWPPFSVTTADGALEGIDSDVLRLIERQSGLRFRYIPATSWTNAIDLIKSGSVAFLCGVAESEDRLRYMRFTSAYISFPSAIVTNRGDIYTTITSLAGKKIAIPSNYIAEEWARAAVPDAEFIHVEDETEAHRLVANYEADATIANIVVSAHLIRRHGYSHLKVSAITTVFPLRYGVRLDAGELHGILDKSLRSISAREIDAITQPWIHPEVDEALTWRRVRPLLRYGAGILLLVIGTSIVWIWRLRREVARREHAEQQLQLAHAELSDAHEQRKRLMQVVAHDVRNPLTSLIGCAALLGDRRDLPAESRPLLHNLTHSAQRIERLVRNLLDYETLQHGRYPLQAAEVDLLKVLHHVLARLEIPARDKQIIINTESLGECPPVQADPTACEGILENLLTNAIKYSPAGTEVRVRSTVTDSALRLAVTDEGPGLDSRDVERLFQRFGRLGAKPTGGETSIGLGLWIAHELAELQQGRLWCESKPGNGSTFYFELPLAPMTANVASQNT